MFSFNGYNHVKVDARIAQVGLHMARWTVAYHVTTGLLVAR